MTEIATTLARAAMPPGIVPRPQLWQLLRFAVAALDRAAPPRQDYEELPTTWFKCPPF
jgi:hypothetical protein